MLLEGLAGAVKGGSEAVGDIAVRQQEADISSLAQRLKQEAELELQNRGFGQSKELEGIKQSNRMDITEKESLLRRQETKEDFNRKLKAGLFNDKVDSKNKYSMSQQIDDLSTKYRNVIEAAKDSVGYIDPTAQESINQAYAKDEQLIRSGGQPKYLNEFLMGKPNSQTANPKTLRLIYKDGKMVPAQ